MVLALRNLLHALSRRKPMAAHARSVFFPKVRGSVGFEPTDFCFANLVFFVQLWVHLSGSWILSLRLKLNALLFVGIDIDRSAQN